MSRLIVISNRVSLGGGAQGGLAVAMSAALRQMGGIWFGWSGEVTNRFTGQINMQRIDGLTTATVDLEEQDVEEYYNGYANRTLWPLLHYRIDLAEYERGFAEGYRRTNVRFAETVVPLIEPDDVVWVQDYHMFPLAAELRKRGVKNRIGFFLHTPWPPRRLMVTLPEAEALVTTLLQYDVIGFHTDEWLSSFCDFAVDELGGEVDGDGVLRLNGRTVRLVTCPIGIEAEQFAQMATEPAAIEIYNRVKASLVGRSMIIGVDRLDYSKGLEQRFAGYERFLHENPSFLAKVVLLQIAPPSRGSVQNYQLIRSTLEQLTGRINGALAALDWVPIRYVNQGYPRDQLAGVYRACKTGLVTPLRDGMNLVAKEYVASQNPEDPGVLVLSRFAGAAAQMKEAILINPHSAEEMSDAIRQALEMPLTERKQRWEALYHNVMQYNVLWWGTRFTDYLQAPTPEPTE